ncbi:MAG: glycosyltransferase [Chthoniobacterales bacterium]
MARSLMRLAYLYSRYPVLSQTFCDTEMIELERQGFELVIGSIHPPLTTMRHAHAGRLQAPIHYAPPPPLLRIWEEKARQEGRWPATLVAAHEQKYGAPAKAGLRARNACYFADRLEREGADHLHVHFANRAAHTALFLHAISGLSFSITAHGQDFMADLGNDDLLREICAAAQFVAVETDYSRNLLAARCPDSAAKIHRVFNGMDLSNFPPTMGSACDDRPVRIISIGRLVAFKGFDHLIAACARLRDSGLRFTCEIIGDGPLREALENKIRELHLSHLVSLTGALPQEQVLARLRESDIFALAANTDEAGASDIFPTVILEAMASAKPVVATLTAGIPESVAHGRTGLLVAPNDEAAFASALGQLIQNRGQRALFGSAGRARVEECFQIGTTVAPLKNLFQQVAPQPKMQSSSGRAAAVKSIAYLIDFWPDEQLPLLEEELAQMRRRDIPIVPFVFRTPADPTLNEEQKSLAQHFEFLPDAMVIEAEWRAHPELAARLENDRASHEPRAPSALFLQQARYAVALEKTIRRRSIVHLHATSSRTLLTALMLQEMLGVTVSAAVESSPALAHPFMQHALMRCVGGRVADGSVLDQASSGFMIDRNRHDLASRAARRLHAMLGFDLTGRAQLWQEWSERLVRWSAKRETDLEHD